MIRAFKASVDQVELFFTLCMKLNLNTLEQRLALMDVLSKTENISQLWSVNQEQFINELAKQFNIPGVERKSDEH